MSTWGAVLGGAVACYALKLLGLSVPASLLDHPVVRAIADRLPVALLAGLVAVQVFGGADQRLVLDARAAGLLAAVALLLARAPFLVVVAGAALTAALLRM